ncbi:MAG: DUF624 domain-containing protein [Eubacteriales bacterium]|nr:DUF624 domain-containing protein [Eubacteriales bacterium]
MEDSPKRELASPVTVTPGSKPSSENAEKKKGAFSFFHRALRRKDGAFKNYISILIGYIDTVILYNFFFIGVSLGIVTIGPALVGMVDCYNEFLNNHTEHRYRLFFKKFKENFNLPNVIVGLIFTGCLASIFYLFLFFSQNWGSHAWIIPLWVFANFVLLYLVTSFAFYALGKVRMQLDTKTILSNSFKLAAGSLGSSLMAGLGFAAFFLVPLIFFEYCFPLLIVISFSGAMLSCMMAVYPALDPFVLITPEEEELEEEEYQKDEKPHLRLDLIDKQEEQKK